jgi:hypothetical protein
VTFASSFFKNAFNSGEGAVGHWHRRERSIASVAVLVKMDWWVPQMIGRVDSITRRSVNCRYPPLRCLFLLHYYRTMEVGWKVSFAAFLAAFPAQNLVHHPNSSSFEMATLVLLRAASRRMTPPATSLVTMRALFSTRASDNFLSGASSLYAESMAEMYAIDPSSVPEVSSVDVYFHQSSSSSLFTRKV